MPHLPVGCNSSSQGMHDNFFQLDLNKYFVIIENQLIPHRKSIQN